MIIIYNVCPSGMENYLILGKGGDETLSFQK